MKKLIFVFMTVLLMTACSQETSESKAEETYNIMVKASTENRQLTEKEDAKVKEFTQQLKRDKTTDLDRSISAMYMNFQQPTIFEKAKESADELIN